MAIRSAQRNRYRNSSSSSFRKNPSGGTIWSVLHSFSVILLTLTIHLLTNRFDTHYTKCWLVKWGERRKDKRPICCFRAIPNCLKENCCEEQEYAHNSKCKSHWRPSSHVRHNVAIKLLPEQQQGEKTATDWTTTTTIVVPRSTSLCGYAGVLTQCSGSNEWARKCAVSACFITQLRYFGYAFDGRQNKNETTIYIMIPFVWLFSIGSGVGRTQWAQGTGLWIGVCWKLGEFKCVAVYGERGTQGKLLALKESSDKK